MRVLAVCAYAKYLGVCLFEPGDLVSERGNLISSGGCEVEDVERKDDVFGAEEVTELDSIAGVRRKIESGGLLSDIC